MQRQFSFAEPVLLNSVATINSGSKFNSWLRALSGAWQTLHGARFRMETATMAFAYPSEDSLAHFFLHFSSFLFRVARQDLIEDNFAWLPC